MYIYIYICVGRSGIERNIDRTICIKYIYLHIYICVDVVYAPFNWPPGSWAGMIALSIFECHLTATSYISQKFVCFPGLGEMMCVVVFLDLCFAQGLWSTWPNGAKAAQLPQFDTW